MFLSEFLNTLHPGLGSLRGAGAQGPWQPRPPSRRVLTGLGTLPQAGPGTPFSPGSLSLSLSLSDQNFLDNFPSSDVLSFVARIFLLFQMVTVYPLLGYLARVQLLGHVFGDPYPR